ncbi:amidohydrolase [Kangiella koreensis]|uniref:Amidohydrolase 3 n=1 Tax=Kangiella koreensis (strain DSM 16069 / JCM 12317 / KCTC 12182 / SW-125) TaxID=523791 RepID=C7R5V8_KANKD|nr:amidohydrolase [Kangiella koreensis]ACV27282.1 Amidohydrolase 3 [Kangiella koreensis DSM 16069]
MRMTKWIVGFALLITSSLFTVAQALPTLIHNVKGYTFADGELVQFDSLLFEKDTVIAYGSHKDLADTAKVSIAIDGKGATLLPGLTDAHGHVLGLGLNLMRVDLRGIDSLDQTLQTIKDYAKANSELRWIQGRGWNQVLWAKKEFPTKQMLDPIINDRPVWLSRIDGHAGWANSKALELAGITKDTVDPAGGKIIKDANGEPTGVLVDAAMGLVESKIPELNSMERRTALELAFDHMLKLGITSVHDAGVDFETYKLMLEMAKQNQIPVRLYGMLSGSDTYLKTMLELGKVELPFLKFRSVKLYSDGALGSRGAALLAPYSDDPDNKGLLLTTEKKLAADLSLITQYGFQANVHAIGDAANRLVLDAFAKLPEEQSADVLRHRIEHAQVVALDDIPRFAELNIIASMQPTHATSDMNMAGDRLGNERLKGAYAWRKMREHDVLIAAGSDFPVELANPFLGIHAAVTRQSSDNQPEGGWLPGEKLDRAETLKAFTIDAAYSGFWEDEIGSLETGKKADFILIDRDIFSVEPELLDDVNVLQTWVGGKRLH